MAIAARHLVRGVQPGAHVRADLAGEDRPEGGDSGGDADLAEGAVDPRAHARLTRRDDGDRGRGERRVDQADADAADDQFRGAGAVQCDATVITVIITAIMSRRRRKNGEPADMTQDGEIDRFLSGFSDGTPQGDVLHEPAMRHVATASPESADVMAQRQAVSEMAAEQPDDVARALRNWLNTKGS